MTGRSVEFRFEWTPAHARRVFWRSLWRLHGAWILGSALAAALALLAKDRGVLRWSLGLLALLGAAYASLLIWSWRQATSATRELAARAFAGRLGDGGIEFESAGRRIRVVWSELVRVWILHDLVLLSTRGSSRPLAIPAEALGAEGLEALVERAGAAGVLLRAER